MRIPLRFPPDLARRTTVGSVLIGVLWCVVLLAVIVVGVLHTARLDLTVGKYHSDRIQARYLAIAGIEKAKALLYEDALSRSRAGIHHGAGLYNNPGEFRDVPLGRGTFRVVRAGSDDEGGGVVFGVSDEESRLNVNFAEIADLTKILGLTPDVAAAIVDWRDSDSAVSPGGAEAPFYESVQPPHLPRNGPFATIRELLMVRGISRELLFGESPARSPISGAAESSTGGGAPSENEDDIPPEAGWAALLTAFSTVQDVDATGKDRVNAQTADEAALTGVRGVTPAIARAVIAHRGRNQLQSIADLLDVAAAQPGQRGNLNGQGGDAGAKAITEILFKEIVDQLTVEDRTEHAGAVNINTASVEVLMCLPGLSRPLAQAIVAQRRSNGFFPHIAALLDVPGVTRDIFKQLASRVTVRSETFRILSEGRVRANGTRQRIEAVVHVGLNSVTTLAYREDDL